MVLGGRVEVVLTFRPLRLGDEPRTKEDDLRRTAALPWHGRCRGMAVHSEHSGCAFPACRFPPVVRASRAPAGSRSHRGEEGTPATASARWRNALCPTLSRPVPVYLAIPETCAPLNSQTNHVTIFRTAQMTRYPTYDVVATEVGLPADARAPTSVATAPCRTRRVRTRSSAEHFSGRGRRGAPNQRLLWLGN